MVNWLHHKNGSALRVKCPDVSFSQVFVIPYHQLALVPPVISEQQLTCLAMCFFYEKVSWVQALPSEFYILINIEVKIFIFSCITLFLIGACDKI